MIERARVLDALTTVRDPELDQSLVELGFVRAVRIDGVTVSVSLRLPTYFCAPNFAYLMAADAQAAVSSVDGVQRTRVLLEDHFTSREINEGLAQGKDFDATFPEQTIGEGLGGLRNLFRRKAFIARQGRLSHVLQKRGVTDAELSRLRLTDLPPGAETEAYLARRRELGIDTSENAPFLMTADGRPVPSHQVRQHVRFARTVSSSIEGNAEFCRGLLRTRYRNKVEEVGS
jgi:metal-sulfur cluster biosynthetic enzyme